MSKLLYQGSVKNVYVVDNTHLEFEFSDAYSVFDWGRMPDSIPGKGIALAALTESIYLKLSDSETWKKLDHSQTLAATIAWYSKMDSNSGKDLISTLRQFQSGGMKTHFQR